MSYLRRIVGPMLLGAATIVTLGVLAMHSTLDSRRQELHRETPGAAARAETEATMKSVAAANQHAADQVTAAKDAEFENSPQRQRIKELEDQDRQWLAAHPPSRTAAESSAR
jgi:hypothetical protein